jgi:hypothetical protein
VSKRQDEIKESLDAIAAANGKVLRPADVVEDARDEESPLHREFIWDDTAAAIAHRLWQARELILSVYVTIVAGDPATLTRAYVSLRADRRERGGGYRAIVDVLSDSGRRTALLAEAKHDMAHFVRKYKTFSELAPVVKAMRKALRRKRRQKAS